MSQLWSDSPAALHLLVPVPTYRDEGSNRRLGSPLSLEGGGRFLEIHVHMLDSETLRVAPIGTWTPKGMYLQKQ